MTESFGMTNYANPKQIYEKIDELLKLPVVSFKKEALKEYHQYFEEKCKKSEKMIIEAKKYIPGCRGNFC